MAICRIDAGRKMLFDSGRNYALNISCEFIFIEKIISVYLIFQVSVSDNLYQFIHDLWLQNAPIGELS